MHIDIIEYHGFSYSQFKTDGVHFTYRTFQNVIDSWYMVHANNNWYGVDKIEASW